MAVKIWGKVAVRLSKHLFWRGVESIAPVTRRVGGLENLPHNCDTGILVTRRVGGLEINIFQSLEITGALANQ